jgi:hypothetical protein
MASQAYIGGGMVTGGHGQARMAPMGGQAGKKWENHCKSINFFIFSIKSADKLH